MNLLSGCDMIKISMNGEPMKKNISSLSEEVYQHLLDQIFSNQLKPNEKIAESKIAAEFNTSRTPIREAMRKLQSQGLINIYPNRHAEVASFTTKEIQDIGTLRISLDLLSIKLAALYGSRADFIYLQDLANQCLQAFYNNNGYLRRKLDTDFHMELCCISQNELLYQMQKDLSLKIQFILLHYEFPIENEEEHLKQHLTIIDCIMNNEIEKAKKMSIQHLMEFYHLDIKDPEEFFMK